MRRKCIVLESNRTTLVGPQCRSLPHKGSATEPPHASAQESGGSNPQGQKKLFLKLKRKVLYMDTLLTSLIVTEEISGLRGREYEDYCLLGRDVVFSGKKNSTNVSQESAAPCPQERDNRFIRNVCTCLQKWYGFSSRSLGFSTG
jgi:hypothetical protein